jgi:ATP-binding cassette subfamily F protein 2
MKKYEKEQEDIKHIKHFIATCGTYANLVKQAKSKQKILDKVCHGLCARKVLV